MPDEFVGTACPYGIHKAMAVSTYNVIFSEIN